MPMYRIRLALSALASLQLLACTGHSGGSSTSAELPKFTAANEDLEKLVKAGCTIQDAKVTCDPLPVSALDEDDQIANLAQKENRAKQQKTTVDAMNENVEKAAKSGAYSGADADVLSAQLTAMSAELAGRIANLDVQIINEKNYQLVLGYHCESSYQRGGSEIKSKSDLLLAGAGAGAGQQKGLVQNDDAKYVSQVVLSTPAHDVQYTLAGTPEAKSQSLRQFVQTDGEFVAQAEGGAAGKMNC